MANTPYRKRNNGYEYLGQFITDKDIDRLKEYVKEMNNLVSSAEKYKAMEDNSKGSSQQAEYTKNFNAAMDKIQNRSKTFSIGMAKNLGEIKGVIQDYITLIDDFNDNIENMQKNTDKFIKGLQKSNTTKFDSSNNKNFKLNSDNLIDALTNTLSLRSNRENNDRNNATRKAIIDAVTNKYKDKNGIIDPDKQDDIVEEINEGIKNANLPEFGKVAGILNAAGVALKAFATEGLQLLKEGLGRQTGAFRDTFTGISVRTGMTRGEYYDAQWHTNNVLSANGMRGSMATSEVQNQISTLVQNGVGLSSDRDTMITNAIETALTHSIVPYLDTSNAYYQQLITNQPSLNKTIRGIGRATNDMLGSSVVAKEYLETMVNDLSPMSELAEQELGLQYAQATGYLEALRSQGMSDMEIGEIFNVARGIQNDLYGSLNSGNVDVVTAVSELISNPNLDPANISDIMQAYAPRAGGWANNGREDRLAPLDASILATQSALSPTTLARMNKKNYDWDKAAIDAQKVVNGVGNYAEFATQQYKSGGNLTNAKIQEIYMENVTNELAVITEWLGYFMKPIQAIAGAVASYAGGKALKWAGGKLLSNGGNLSGAGTYLNAGLQQGFMKGSTTAFGAGKLGFMSNTAGAVAGSLGVAAGGAMAIKGTSDVISDFQNHNVNAGTAMSGIGAAGGAVGAGALLALGASNPIGWIALAVGGAALLGRSLYDSAHNYEKAGAAIKAEWDEYAVQLSNETMQKEENLLVLRERFEDEQNIEQARKDLIQSGMLSEEDMQKAQQASRDELISLTNQYIKSTKEFGEAEQALLNKKQNEKIDDANETAQSIKKWFEKEYKGENGDTKENNEIAKNLISNMVTTLNSKGASNWTDQEKKFMERYNSNLAKGKLTDYNDLKWVLEGGGTWWGISDAVMQNATTVGSSGFVNYANERGAGITGFANIDKSLIPYVTAIQQAKSKTEAEKAIANAKQAGVKFDDWKDDIQPTLTKYNIDKFRSGLNKVPYDDFPALLHENEAILTASTANELRGLLDEYRSANEQNISFDAIIQQQTAALVERMDKIIQVVQGQTSSSDLQDAINNSSRMGRIAKNMLSMKNISAFNN